MNDLDTIIRMFDYITDTNRKKHIVGGVLLSASLLFGGLAFTVMTLKVKEKESDEN